VDVIQNYCNSNNLSSRIKEKSPKPQRKVSKETKGTKIDTQAETFKLFKEGNSVADIARTRMLTIQTIEGHLVSYILKGKINIEELVSREKLLLIEPVVKEFEGGSIKPIKDKLGESVGFGEIRLVIAWEDYKKNIMD